MWNTKWIMIVMALLAVAITLGEIVKDAKKGPVLQWDYSEKRGPKTWAKTFDTCAGARQSPIDIVTKNVMVMTGTEPLIVGKEKHLVNATVVNAGPLIVINVADTKKHKISGGGLPSSPFKLVKITFHWGNNNVTGSEHTMDGKGSPFEMKFVYVNAKHKTKEEVLSDPKGIAIVAVNWDVMTHNEELEKITKMLPQVMYKGQQATLPDLDLSKLMPSLQNFYRYQGSLTFPPCSENVQWTIPTQKMYLSAEQLKQFRTVYSTSQSETSMAKMFNNIREAQPLNQRNVYMYGSGQT